jgi:probable HAF family extracellular repeat protein
MRRLARISSTWLMLLVVAATLMSTSGGGDAAQASTLPTRSNHSIGVAAKFPNQQTHFQNYSVVELATLGGSFGTGNGINDRGWITGFAALPADATVHATLWNDGHILDLGTLGGPNSNVSWPIKSNAGNISGMSDTPAMDPFAEDFCLNGVPNTCLGFDWRNGVMHALPTLGGNNGAALANNSLGDIVGTAETATQNPSCVAPQVFDHEAVLWDRRTHRASQLPNLTGDIAAAALAINDWGDAVGASGAVCAPAIGKYSQHAVLWHNGVPTSLPTLGGSKHNVALAINDRGQIAGASDLPGDAVRHAVLWHKGALIDLGTLPGDVLAVAFGMNNWGQVVGMSEDASGNDRAFLWQNGVMIDLNSLIPPSSNLYLFFAGDINDRGVISGEAVDLTTGNQPAFEAIPQYGAMLESAQRRRFALPAGARGHILRSGLRIHGGLIP